jgi:hypothetical protein
VFDEQDTSNETASKGEYNATKDGCWKLENARLSGIYSGNVNGISE